MFILYICAWKIRCILYCVGAIFKHDRNNKEVDENEETEKLFINYAVLINMNKKYSLELIDLSIDIFQRSSFPNNYDNRIETTYHLFDMPILFKICTKKKKLRNYKQLLFELFSCCHQCQTAFQKFHLQLTEYLIHKQCLLFHSGLSDN